MLLSYSGFYSFDFFLLLVGSEFPLRINNGILILIHTTPYNKEPSRQLIMPNLQTNITLKQTNNNPLSLLISYLVPPGTKLKKQDKHYEIIEHSFCFIIVSLRTPSFSHRRWAVHKKQRDLYLIRHNLDSSCPQSSTNFRI